MSQAKKEKDRSGEATPERSEETIVANELLSEGEPSSFIVSEFTPAVKDLLCLKEFRERTGLQAKDLVEILSDEFPKFSKQSFSMCENPSQYGIVLHPAGFEKLQSLFPQAAITKKKKKKSGKNRLKKRISARLNDAEYAALIEKIKLDGFDTMQAFLVFVVRNYLKEK